MNKVNYKIILMGFLLLIILGCKHTKKPFLQRIQECTYDGRMDEYTFYSFDTTKFYNTVVQTYFRDGIEIDSVYSKMYNGDSVLYYTFKDDSSKIGFSLFDLSKGRRNFDVAYLELKSNMLVLKNGIRINMTRSEFFNKLRIRETDCDTFEIHLNQEYSGKYFRFVFEGDKLKSINKEYVH